MENIFPYFYLPQKCSIVRATDVGSFFALKKIHKQIFFFKKHRNSLTAV